MLQIVLCLDGDLNDTTRVSCHLASALMIIFCWRGFISPISARTQNGAIFGPFFICPFLIFSGFFIHLTDAHPVMHWLFHISFLKYALEGASLAIFGYDRPRMDCDQLFCQFVLPKKFMKEVDMHKGDIVTVVSMLFVIFMLFRCAAFLVMYLRLGAKR